MPCLGVIHVLAIGQSTRNFVHASNTGSMEQRHIWPNGNWWSYTSL